jgi:hypothetical protein
MTFVSVNALSRVVVLRLKGGMEGRKAGVALPSPDHHPRCKPSIIHIAHKANIKHK